MQFSVWAPKADRVDIALSGGRRPMARAERGWWRGEFADAGPGTDYGFCLNNGGPLPDPRSAHQPHGVHGLSRVVDHAAYHWSDKHWQAPPFAAAVVYELHIGTFTPAGTFDAAIERLDHLVELGITHVEIMPVAHFEGNHGWGYDGVALFAPHHAYGGPEGLKRLVDACHTRGLAALLDVVYNHLGPSGNYLPQFGPYFTERHHTPWGAAVNYDGAGSDEVRRFVCDNALMWLRDYHLDGLRLDAVQTIVDTSAMHLLEQLAREVEVLEAHVGRSLVLVAETDANDPRLVRSEEIGGYGLDAQWADDIHHAIHGALTGERVGYYADFGTMADLATAMREPFVYAGRRSEYRQRCHGRSPGSLSGHKFAAFLQNHDQVGNRAQGDRIGQLTSRERVKIGSALVLLGPCVPMLFQGEEWDATARFQFFVDFHANPGLARAVADGRRREFAAFGWKPEQVPDPRERDTFLRSKLDWREVTAAPHAEMLTWYRDLIALRRRFAILTDGEREAVACRFDEGAKWLVVERGELTIVANLAERTARIPVCATRPREVLIASSRDLGIEPEAVTLPRDSVVVFGPRDSVS